MSANPIYEYQYVTKSVSDFDLKGYPGKWNKVVSVSNSTVNFTGSNFGASAFLMTAVPSATASMAKGGSIDLSLLSADTMYEIPVSRITSNDTNVIYVFIENKETESNKRGIY